MPVKAGGEFARALRALGVLGVAWVVAWVVAEGVVAFAA